MIPMFTEKKSRPDVSLTFSQSSSPGDRSVVTREGREHQARSLSSRVVDSGGQAVVRFGPCTMCMVMIYISVS